MCLICVHAYCLCRLHTFTGLLGERGQEQRKSASDFTSIVCGPPTPPPIPTSQHTPSSWDSQLETSGSPLCGQSTARLALLQSRHALLLQPAGTQGVGGREHPGRVCVDWRGGGVAPEAIQHVLLCCQRQVSCRRMLFELRV